MEKQQLRKIYSKNQIDIATFIGGPLIAGYLLSQNFKTFGEKEAAKKSTIFSILGLLLLISAFVLLPESITSKIPNIFVAVIPIVIASLVVRIYQSKKIEEYLKSGYKTASSLGVFGESLLSLIITLILYIAIIQITTSLNVKYAYGNYLKNYCNSSYNEKNIRRDKTYVPEDASCFVYTQLKEKGYTLEQVDKVLTLEFEYQKKIGIVSESNQTIMNNSTAYEPLPFIRDNQTFRLSDNQINEILTIEDKYLQLIGVVETKN
jgi:hypothetical protein